MPFDLAAHLGVTIRTVRNLERDGRPAKAVIVAAVYDTDAADLWNALTSAERLRRWFLPISGDLHVGGRYQFEGNAGGLITECIPPRRLGVTWEFGGSITWVTVTLMAEGHRTLLELEHVAPVDPHWEKFGPGAVGVGWELGLMGLAKHVADPDVPLDPAEGMNSPSTPDGKNFVRLACNGWAEADIATGADRESALASAERTRRFYTGETPPQAG